MRLGSAAAMGRWATWLALTPLVELVDRCSMARLTLRRRAGAVLPAELHPFVTTYAHRKEFSFTPYPDEIPRCYLDSWN